MVEDIFLLTDYQQRFGQKHDDFPYRSGMDKNLLQKYFAGHGFEAHFLSFSDIDFRETCLRSKYVLYTSSEDIGYHYKSYIEDIVLGLELQGTIVIPAYKYLRANNNKVFMEILRDQMNFDLIKNIKSHHFGTIEELKNNIEKVDPQSVIKSAAGAMSSGVHLSKSRNYLIKEGKKVSRTKNLYKELWDLGRSLKHKGYKRESRYRKKFIVQNYVPELSNDWKILVYDKKYYVLYRNTRKNDFRASGSGNFVFREDVPTEILDYAEKIYKKFHVADLSIDVVFNGNDLYLLEFQAVYFGATTIVKSPFYFIKTINKWDIHRQESELEKVYVDSIISYIRRIKKTNSSGRSISAFGKSKSHSS